MRGLLFVASLWLLGTACSTDRQQASSDDLAVGDGADLSPRPDLAGAPDLSTPDLTPVNACANAVQDGDETDVDCGGPDCVKCAAGKRCALDKDCETGHCNNTICGGPPSRFAVPVDYKVGLGPGFLAAGDFDGDGRPDLAIANTNGGDVSILVNRGTGVFRAASAYAAGNSPSTIAVGDLDGDQHVDLAVAATGEVIVLLGNGDGTFRAVNRPAACQGLRWVAIAELTGDGKADIAEACVGFPPFNTLKTLTLLEGDGAGGFPSTRTLPADDGPDVVLAADVTGDKKVDLVLASGLNRITTMVGDGKGGFAAAASSALQGFAVALALGDLNGDGKLDAVSAELVAMMNVTVLLGNGDGTWRHGDQPTAGVGPRSITLGDFNRDGKLDFAAASTGLLMRPDSAVRVFTGDGKGGFTFASTLSAGMGPAAVVAADFNADGRDDLAIANSIDNTVSVLINNAM